MEARIKNLQTILTDAWGPLVALGKSLATSPIPEKTRELVHIRTSQINGCAVCLDGHIAKSKETPQRLGAVAVWREAPFFSDSGARRLGARRGHHPARRPNRARAGRDLERGQAALRRTSARVARVRGRGGQPLQPPQRGDPAGRWHAALVSKRMPCKLK